MRDNDSAFGDDEFRRMKDAEPFSEITERLARSVGTEMERSIVIKDWVTVENMLMRLIATPLEAGDLSALQPSGIGGLALAIEQMRITNETSLSVRLATVLVSIWTSHIKMQQLAWEQWREEQLRVCAEQNKGDEQSAKRHRVA